MTAPHSHAVTRREIVAVGLLLLAAGAIFTWPLPVQFASAVHNHDDPMFSLWRLGWVAHALPSDPAGLFHANIFHPTRYTLAFSDAMLLPAVVGTPFIWLGVPLIPVYNALLFAGFVGSGMAMYALARDMGCSRAGGVLGALVFSFAPYRLSHSEHLELQWAQWLPLALLAARRTLTTATWRPVVAFGLCVGAAFLSSLYYGLFLLVYLAVWIPTTIVSLKASRIAHRRSVLLIAAVPVALAFLLPYFMMYREARAIVGERSTAERVAYSASASNLVATPPANRMWGAVTSHLGSQERYLFPGATASALALGAFGPSVRVIAWPFAAGLLVSMDAARGPNGIVYPAFAKVIWPLRGLRAPARFGILMLLSVGALAALGLSALEHRLRSISARASAWVPAVIILLCAVEYWSGPASTRTLPVKAPPVYEWLRGQPAGVVLELPVPRPEGLWLYETTYQYMSTFHWHPLLNGYSGLAPAAYVHGLPSLGRLPDAESVEQIRDRGVTYVILHESYYDQTRLDGLMKQFLASPDLVPLVRTPDATGGMAMVFRLDHR